MAYRTPLLHKMVAVVIGLAGLSATAACDSGSSGGHVQSPTPLSAVTSDPSAPDGASASPDDGSSTTLPPVAVTAGGYLPGGPGTTAAPGQARPVPPVTPTAHPATTLLPVDPIPGHPRPTPTLVPTPPDRIPYSCPPAPVRAMMMCPQAATGT